MPIFGSFILSLQSGFILLLNLHVANCKYFNSAMSQNHPLLFDKSVELI